MVYRGKRRERWGESFQLAAAAVLALTGALFIVFRIWGMRFSGFLLIGLAALLVLEVFLERWAKASKSGWWCQLAFRAAVAIVLIPLVVIEVIVMNVGGSDMSPLPADAVVVLGAGVNGRSPSLALRTRLDAALLYLERNPDVPVVLTGGQGYGEEVTEARCMYDYLTERGIDGRRLILEERAENTAENFALSRDLLAEQGVDPSRDRVAVVTNDFHMARSQLIAAREGYGNVFGVPAKLPWRHLSVNYYLREAFALVKTLIFD